MKSFTRVVEWDSITMLLFWFHQTVPEPLYKATEQLSIDISLRLVEEGARTANLYEERLFMEAMNLVIVHLDKEFFQVVSTVISKVDRLVGSIAQIASIQSESGQLSPRTIFEILLNTSESNTFLIQPHVL